MVRLAANNNVGCRTRSRFSTRDYFINRIYAAELRE
jgi:hypothetical protein